MFEPRVSIIIRCYNEQEHIAQLLTGVFEQSIKNVEVIVVDSGSKDRTLSIASTYPVTICSISAEEFSFGHALNVGCEAASGDILVFASAHVYPVHRRWLENLIAPFEKNKVALSYGRQIVNGTNKYSEHQILSKWFPQQSVLIQRTPFCNNANAAIRRSLWKQLPYDESLTGLEDLDWARRVIGMGYHLSYVAEAEVVHVHNETLMGIFNRYFRESIVYYHIFSKQKFRLGDFLWLWLLNTGSDCIHAYRDGKLSDNALQIALFRLMQFWGTYRGFLHRDPVSDSLRQRFYYPNGLNGLEHGQALSQDNPQRVDCIEYPEEIHAEGL